VLFVPLLLSGFVAAARGAAPAADTLLPATTKALFSVGQFPDANQRFDSTRVGQMLADPALEPFFKDLRRQLREKWAKNKAELGTTWEDFEPAASGEVALALVHPARGNPGIVFIADATGRTEQAQQLLTKITQDMSNRRAKRLNVQAGGVAVQGYEIPASEAGEQPDYAYYVLHKDVILASNELPVLDDVLRRLAAPQPKDALASVPAYRAVMARSAKGSGNDKPEARWFIEPLGLLAAIEARREEPAKAGAPAARGGQPAARGTARAATPAKKKSTADTYRALGFGAIQGTGGFIYMPKEKYDFLTYSAIHAPKPWEKSMNMLALPNSTNLEPVEWVPADVALHIAFNIDVKQAEMHFEPLFDQIFGEGETGVWTDVKDSLRDDPNGPGIDLVADLVNHLGQRATFVVDYQLPISPTCERSCLGINAVNEKALALAVRKSMETDPNVKHRQFQGFDIWEMTEDEPVATPKVEFDEPGTKSVGRPRVGNTKEAEEETSRLLPRSAVCVARGHLFVASHVDFLEKILAQTAANGLTTSSDYQAVAKDMQAVGAAQNCLRTFIRRDQALRPTYELIRRNQLPEAQTMIASLINRLMAGDDDSQRTRSAEIDGSKLPPFEQIQHYLGRGGMCLTAEADGWFAVSFTPKDTQAQVGARPSTARAQ
jgi:hypothetical protein